MNRIHNLILASWRKRLSFPILLAVLLASSGLRGADPASAIRPVATLDKDAANKLLVHTEKPEYPPIARVNYIQGTVHLKITVSPKGKVVEAHVIKGEPLLAAAAIKAVRKWRYRPYISSNGPAPFNAIVGVKFAIIPQSPIFHQHFPSHPDDYLEKQIRPPEVVNRPQADPSDDRVKFRVLLNSKGKVLDAVPMGGKHSETELAKENLRQWKFRPARWGALAVPWYLIVNVPLMHALVDHVDGSARR